MEPQKCFENYPLWIVVTSNIVSLSIYFIGGFLVYQAGWFWLLLYIAYILFLEIKLLKGRCVNCYYFGKTCFSGKGRLSCLFFKKGEPKKFNNIKLGWQDLIPDFLVSVIPILVGIVILVINFDWIILLLVLALFFLGFSASAFIRVNLACKYCKQRQLGCPAQKFFNKK